MLLLGLDSATRVGSVGIVRADLEAHACAGGPAGRLAEGCQVLAEVSRDSGLAHGESLLALIDACLEQAGVRLEDLGGIAVSSGPGSFTGLRVGLATAKGLALGRDLAIVGVPTLEAFAASLLPGWGAAPSGEVPAPGALVAACLDARKGEVYAALFAVRAPAWDEPCPQLERLSPDAASRPGELGAALARAVAARRTADGPGPRLFLVGDGAQRYAGEIVQPLADRARALPPESFHPRGSAVARLGVGLLARGGADDRAALVPQYARASEAEIVRRRAGEPQRG